MGVKEKHIEFSDEVTDVSDEEVVMDKSDDVDLTDVGDDIIDEDIDPLDRLPKEAVRNDDGTVTLPLHYPVTLKTRKNGNVRERHFNELKFHRLNGGDFRVISSTPEQHQTIVSIARSAKLNQAVMNALFDKMTDIDITNSGKVLNHFLANGPKAGRRS